MNEEFANVSQASTLQANENRTSARRRMAPMTYVEIGTENGGLLLDVSEGGLGLHAAHTLPAGKQMNLRFRLPRSKETVESKAEIAWIGPSQKRAGLRFIGLPESARASIAEWVSQEPDELLEGAEPATRETDRSEWQREFRLPEASPIGAGEGDSAALGRPGREGSEASQAAERVETAQAEQADTNLPSFRLNESSLFGPIDPVAITWQAPRRSSWTGLWTLLVFAFVAAAFTLGLAIGTGKVQVSGAAAALIEFLGWQQPPAPPAPKIPGGDVVTTATVPTSAPSGASADSTAEPQASTPPGTSPTVTPQANPPVPTSGSIRASESNATSAPNTISAANASGGSKNGDKKPERRSVLVRAPGRGSLPLLLSLPEQTILASGYMAIISRRAVEIAPLQEEGQAAQPQRVTVGRLLFDPTQAIEGATTGSDSGTVEVLARVGLGGEVVEAKLVSGPEALGALVSKSIREWLYEPTLVDGRPVESQDDIRIVFGHP